MNMRFDPNSKIARAKMQIAIADLMRAIDDLEHVVRRVFDGFEPMWDEDERLAKRALAVLHAYVREINRP